VRSCLGVDLARPSLQSTPGDVVRPNHAIVGLLASADGAPCCIDEGWLGQRALEGGPGGGREV